jgi:hypothetical protein
LTEELVRIWRLNTVCVIPLEKVKRRVKFTPEQNRKAQRGSRCTAVLSFLTSALDGGGCTIPLALPTTDTATNRLHAS